MKINNLSKILIVLSLVFGFYIDENLNLGAIGDWLHTDKPVIEALSADIEKTLLTSDSINKTDVLIAVKKQVKNNNSADEDSSSL